MGPGVRIRSAAIVLVVLVAVADAALLCVIAAAPRGSAVLAPADIRPAIGFGYQIAIPAPVSRIYLLRTDHVDSPRGSNLTLAEDGAAMGPAHTQHVMIQERGRGVFSYWNGVLIFSTPDNTDPRTNGRRYTVSYSLSAEPRVMKAAGILSLFLAAAALVALLRVLRAAQAMAAYLRGRRPRLKCFAIAAVPPVFLSAGLLAFLTPTWNMFDSSGFFFSQLSQIPHFPPLYPQFMHFAVTWFGVTDRTLWFVQGTQHTLTVAAIAYLAASQTRVATVLLLSVATSVGALFHLYAHGIYSEGPALAFLIFQVGAFLRIAQNRWPAVSALVIYHIALLLAILTRHSFVLLGVMLPGYLAAVALLDAKGRRAALRHAVVAGALGVGVLVADQLVVRGYCAALATESTPITGRAGVYRMQRTGRRFDEKARTSFIGRLQATTQDPAIQVALDVMVRHPEPWLGTHTELSKREELRLRNVDEVMNTAFAIYLRAWEPNSFRQMRDEFVKFFTPRQISWILSEAWRDVVVTFRGNPTISSRMRAMTILTTPRVYRYKELESNPVVTLLDSVTPRHLLLGLAGVWLVGISAGILRTRDGGVVALLVLSGLGYLLGMVMVTIYVARYVAPFLLILWVCAGLTTGHLLERVRPATREPSG